MHKQAMIGGSMPPEWMDPERGWVIEEFSLELPVGLSEADKKGLWDEVLTLRRQIKRIEMRIERFKAKAKKAIEGLELKKDAAEERLEAEELREMVPVMVWGNLGTNTAYKVRCDNWRVLTTRPLLREERLEAMKSFGQAPAPAAPAEPETTPAPAPEVPEFKPEEVKVCWIPPPEYKAIVLALSVKGAPMAASDLAATAGLEGEVGTLVVESILEDELIEAVARDPMDATSTPVLYRLTDAGLSLALEVAAEKPKGQEVAAPAGTDSAESPVPLPRWPCGAPGCGHAMSDHINLSGNPTCSGSSDGKPCECKSYQRPSVVLEVLGSISGWKIRPGSEDVLLEDRDGKTYGPFGWIPNAEGSARLQLLGASQNPMPAEFVLEAAAERIAREDFPRPAPLKLVRARWAEDRLRDGQQFDGAKTDATTEAALNIARGPVAPEAAAFIAHAIEEERAADAPIVRCDNEKCRHPVSLHLTTGGCTSRRGVGTCKCTKPGTKIPKAPQGDGQEVIPIPPASPAPAPAAETAPVSGPEDKSIAERSEAVDELKPEHRKAFLLLAKVGQMSIADFGKAAHSDRPQATVTALEKRGLLKISAPNVELSPYALSLVKVMCGDCTHSLKVHALTTVGKCFGKVGRKACGCHHYKEPEIKAGGKPPAATAGQAVIGGIEAPPSVAFHEVQPPPPMRFETPGAVLSWGNGFGEASGIAVCWLEFPAEGGTVRPVGPLCLDERGNLIHPKTEEGQRVKVREAARSQGGSWRGIPEIMLQNLEAHLRSVDHARGCTLNKAAIGKELKDGWRLAILETNESGADVEIIGPLVSHGPMRFTFITGDLNDADRTCICGADGNPSTHVPEEIHAAAESFLRNERTVKVGPAMEPAPAGDLVTVPLVDLTPKWSASKEPAEEPGFIGVTFHFQAVKGLYPVSFGPFAFNEKTGAFLAELPSSIPPEVGNAWKEAVTMREPVRLTVVEGWQIEAAGETLVFLEDGKEPMGPFVYSVEDGWLAVAPGVPLEAQEAMGRWIDQNMAIVQVVEEDFIRRGKLPTVFTPPATGAQASG
jgi:hypothetical protein